MFFNFVLEILKYKNMDEKQRNISQLERVVSSLEYHLEKYKESKCKSKNGRLQKTVNMLWMICLLTLNI